MTASETAARNAGQWVDLGAVEARWARMSDAEKAAAIQGRASGGPVSAGVPYMVGERGPELFTPAASGMISPHGSGGIATGAIVINLYGTPESLAQQVKQIVMRDVLQGRKVGTA
jgi:phage-related minor tail protein